MSQTNRKLSIEAALEDANRMRLDAQFDREAEAEANSIIRARQLRPFRARRKPNYGPAILKAG